VWEIVGGRKLDTQPDIGRRIALSAFAAAARSSGFEPALREMLSTGYAAGLLELRGQPAGAFRAGFFVLHLPPRGDIPSIYFHERRRRCRAWCRIAISRPAMLRSIPILTH